MEYILIGVCSFFASLITFYTGFGLGTILMPVMAIFLPIPLAISLTAIIHFFHNLLRTGLLWMEIDWKVVCCFGGSALLAVIPGVWVLQKLSLFAPIIHYAWGEISYLHLLIGFLLIFLGTVEIIGKRRIGKKSLILGGLLSGFFGGLTGNQGAFRSIFLVGSFQNQKRFVATSAVISTVVDVLRLILYGLAFNSLIAGMNFFLLIVAIVGSSLAICIGLFWLPKVTIQLIQKLVIILIYILGILIAVGII